MKKLNLESLGDVQVNSMVMDRFSISAVTKTIFDVVLKSNPEELVYTDSDSVDNRKKVIAYDTVANKTAFTFDTELGDSDIILEIKQHIIKYLVEEHSKDGYFGVLADVVVFYADGRYHTEPNTIFSIKNEYVDKDINRIVYNPSHEVCALTTSGELIPICKEDFFDIGILVK